MLELVCRLGGWGRESNATDAFAEFTQVRPLFVESDSGDTFEVADNRREFFAQESFAALKPADQKRVFIFGGSTVQGRPYSIPTSFGTFFEIALNHADPDTNWEVVCCGGISYASYRLLPIMRECLRYEPDVFIVCTGHNEFLECVTYADVRAAHPAVVQSRSLLSHSNCVRLLRNILTAERRPSGERDRALLPAEVDAMLDHQGGLDAYSREALYAESVVEGFRENLDQMISLSESAGIPLLLLAPPSNLSDCPPFKSQFSHQTTSDDRDRIHRLLNASGPLLTDDPRAAIAHLRTVTDLDPHYAFSWYQLGRAFLNARQTEDARAAFIRARDEDVCPLRMTSDLHATLINTAVSRDVHVVDLAKLLARNCRTGILGNAVLADHVHPSFFGNQLIAMELVHEFSDRGYAPTPGEKAHDAIRKKFEQHLTSLDNLYFLRGQRTLESLRAWTQGRADGPPLQLTAEPVGTD